MAKDFSEWFYQSQAWKRTRAAYIVHAGAIDYVTIKIGKRTHKIDTDSDGMTRIRSTFRDSNEETF